MGPQSINDGAELLVKPLLSREVLTQSVLLLDKFLYLY
jgi:hypothetical protein